MGQCQILSSISAAIIGEAASALSRMRSTDFAGASEARVLDRADPLTKLATVMNGKLRIQARGLIRLHIPQRQ
jgi:hypothetical protein